MDKQMNKLTLVMAVAACTLATSAQAAKNSDGLNVFVANSPAVAAEVNENFDLLQSRVAAAQAAANVTFGGTADCSADAEALRTLVNSGVRGTINFSGNCNGPLYPQHRVTLVGSGVDSSSINAVDQDDAEEIIWNRNSRLDIKNTTLNNTLFETTVGSAQGSEIRLEDVKVVGNSANVNDTCLYTRQGSMRLTNVQTESCATAILADNGSFIDLRGTSIIENATNDNDAVIIRHGSSLRVRGGSVQPGAGVTGAQGLSIYGSSSVRQDDGVIDGLRVRQSSSLDIRGGVIASSLDMRGSSARIRDVTYSALNELRLVFSQVDVENLTTNNVNPTIYMRQSRLNIDGGAVTAASANVSTFSAFYIDGGTHDLGLANIRNSSSGVGSNGTVSLDWCGSGNLVDNWDTESGSTTNDRGNGACN